MSALEIFSEMPDDIDIKDCFKCQNEIESDKNAKTLTIWEALTKYDSCSSCVI
jgi:hypothetical protein